MISRYTSVRAVVFDAVGTLIYPDPPAAVAYFEVSRQHGSQLTQRDIQRNFDRALKRRNSRSRTNEDRERDRWRQIVGDVFTDLNDTESLFRQLWDHFAQASSWAVYEDVPDVLAELQSLGMKTAIGSNFDDRLLSIARELPSLNQTQGIFISSRLGFAKPALEFFRAIEAEMQLTVHQLLMVGDDVTNDIQGAHLAGWRSLLLDRGKTGKTDGTIRSLREIVSFVA